MQCDLELFFAHNKVGILDVIKLAAKRVSDGTSLYSCIALQLALDKEFSDLHTDAYVAYVNELCRRYEMFVTTVCYPAHWEIHVEESHANFDTFFAKRFDQNVRQQARVSALLNFHDYFKQTTFNWRN